jgi:N-acetyltransferase
MANALGPALLEGQHIHLEPMGLHHQEDLYLATQDEEIWTYLPNRLTDRAALEQHFHTTLARQAQGLEFPYVVVRQSDGRVVGTTSYLDVSQEHRGVEIGWTWYIPEVWGSEVNPEAKYLLLRHAFEDWGAIRVFFKTDARNQRSQAAIKKLGAQLEGVLRSHRIMPDGYRRDSVYFSIVESEWPSVKSRLEQRLAMIGITSRT